MGLGGGILEDVVLDGAAASQQQFCSVSGGAWLLVDSEMLLTLYSNTLYSSFLSFTLFPWVEAREAKKIGRAHV